MKYQIINLDINDFRAKVEELGAIKVHDKVPYKYTYFYNDNKTIKITLEKDIVKLSARECNDIFDFATNIDNLENLYNGIIAFYENLLPSARKVNVEKKREKWVYDDIYIHIDELPGLPQYVEICAEDEQELKEFMTELGYEKGYELTYFRDNPFKYYTYLHKIPITKIKSHSLEFKTIDKLLSEVSSQTSNKET
jgi:hypothetical protein